MTETILQSWNHIKNGVALVGQIDGHLVTHSKMFMIHS